MRYRIAYDSQKGVNRSVNQDALLVKCGICKKERVVLAVICDGMGGLKKGEVASAAVVRAFSVWFEKELPMILLCGHIEERIVASWDKMIQAVHKRIWKYGEKQGIEMGTTLTAMLFWRKAYYVVQVGDSRAYEVSNKVSKLTQEQTWVEQEVLAGRMSRQEAMVDARRNILLQCVGASKEIEPVYSKGMVLRNVVYLICSDGFWHGVRENELLRAGRLLKGKGELFIKVWIHKAFWQNQKKGEKDDASVIVIST